MSLIEFHIWLRSNNSKFVVQQKPIRKIFLVQYFWRWVMLQLGFLFCFLCIRFDSSSAWSWVKWCICAIRLYAVHVLSVIETLLLNMRDLEMIAVRPKPRIVWSIKTNRALLLLFFSMDILLVARDKRKSWNNSPNYFKRFFMIFIKMPMKSAQKTNIRGADTMTNFLSFNWAGLCVFLSKAWVDYAMDTTSLESRCPMRSNAII